MADGTSSSAVVPGIAGPGERICGRCRGRFDDEPGRDQVTVAEWWVCAPCRAALLPGATPGVAADERSRDEAAPTP